MQIGGILTQLFKETKLAVRKIEPVIWLVWVLSLNWAQNVNRG